MEARHVIGYFAVAAVAACLSAPPLRPAPAPIALDPSTWLRTGQDPGVYRWTGDGSVRCAGAPTMRFEQIQDRRTSADAWAATIASVPADAYRGLRVRFAADVKTENAIVGAALWLRLDDRSQKPLGLCNMISPVDQRLKGTHDFTRLSCVLEVPESTNALIFGLMLTGPGIAWIGPATIEPVGRDVPESPAYKRWNY